MTYFIMEAAGKVNDIKKSTPTKAIFTAVLQEANRPNRNKRIYPKEVIQEAIEAAKDRIERRIFGGELDHPLPTSDETYSMSRHVTPALKELSHIITKTWWKGNLLYGLVETTTTPSGFILAGLIYDKVGVGFSIRALSDNIDYTSEGYQRVGSPMTLIAVDAVSIPSHEKAVIQEVKMLESLLMEAQQICPDGACVIKNHINKLAMLNESTLTHVTNRIFDFYKGNPIKF
jgi:hypothetical protein